MTEKKYPFDVSGHEEYWKITRFALLSKKGGRKLVDFIEGWGQLMDQEIKKAPLTADVIVESCKQVASKKSYPFEDNFHMCFHTLATAWAHGKQMAELMPQMADPNLCLLVRATTSDRNVRFMENYRNDAGKLDTSTPAGQEQENIRILSTMLPSIKLVNLFDTFACDSKQMCHYLLDNMLVLKLPIYVRKGEISDTWYTDIKRLCAGARLHLMNQVSKGKSDKQA